MLATSIKTDPQFLSLCLIPHTISDNVVVTDVIKREEGEEGAISDDDIPPPPPPAQVQAAGDHSEEGECDSESEDGELGEEAKRREGRYRGL